MENKNYEWVPISVQPTHGEIYDIAVKWSDSSNPVMITKTIYQEGRFGINDKYEPFFQELAFFEMGLYEMSYQVKEKIITHYKLHIPLPQ